VLLSTTMLLVGSRTGSLVEKRDIWRIKVRRESMSPSKDRISVEQCSVEQCIVEQISAVQCSAVSGGEGRLHHRSNCTECC
jgi:hypothetical protein